MCVAAMDGANTLCQIPPKEESRCVKSAARQTGMRCRWLGGILH